MVRKVILIMLCCLLCSCVQSHADDWPMFQHDPQHTGYSTSIMPESLQILWEFEGPFSFWTYLIISQGKVIAAPDASIVFSLDITNGSILWETRGSVEGFPTSDKERIYTGLSEGILCLDAITGRNLWQYHEEHVYFESPLVVDGYLVTETRVLFFISGPLVPPDVHEKNKKVFCLDAKTGDIVWEFYSKEPATSPIYYKGGVYIHDGTSIYYLNVKTGDLIWEKESKIEGASYLSLSQDGKKIFVVSYGGLVSCLERNSGQLLWQFDCGSVISNAPAVGYNRVFFRSKQMLYCLDAKKGTLLWKREVGLGSCSPLAAGKKVAVGGENILYILSARSGKIIESYNVGDRITSIALSNGKLVVGSEHSRILCLGSSQNSLYLPVVFILPILIMVLVLGWWISRRF